jgi:hypothetical protein
MADRSEFQPVDSQGPMEEVGISGRRKIGVRNLKSSAGGKWIALYG